MSSFQKSINAAMAALIAGKTLITAFGAAAQVPEADNNVSRYMGVPYVELHKDAGGLMSPNRPMAERTLQGYKAALASEQKNLGDLIDQAVAKVHLGEDSRASLHSMLQHKELFRQNRAYTPDFQQDVYDINVAGDDYSQAYTGVKGGLVITPGDAAYEDQISGGWQARQLPGSAHIPVTKIDLKTFFTEHEKAHLAGANEPQADQIAAIRFLQNNPDKRHVIEIIRDRRQVLAFNWAGDIDYYSKLYGQASVDALDDVLKMPKDQIVQFDDQAARQLLEAGKFNMSMEDLAQYNRAAGRDWKKIQVAIYEQDGEFLTPVKDNDGNIRYHDVNRDSMAMQNLAITLDTMDAAAWNLNGSRFEQLKGSVLRLYDADYKISAAQQPAPQMQTPARVAAPGFKR